MNDIFGDVIATYSRRQAIEDGQQVKLDEKLCKEAGFRFPVYMTMAAWMAAIGAGGTWKPDPEDETGEMEVMELPHGQDCTGRTWDVLNVLLFSIRADRHRSDRVKLTVSVYAYDGRPHRHDVKLVSTCGPVDYDDPAPALTIMLPEED